MGPLCGLHLGQKCLPDPKQQQQQQQQLPGVGAYILGGQRLLPTLPNVGSQEVER